MMMQANEMSTIPQLSTPVGSACLPRGAEDLCQCVGALYKCNTGDTTGWKPVTDGYASFHVLFEKQNEDSPYTIMCTGAAGSAPDLIPSYEFKIIAGTRARRTKATFLQWHLKGSKLNYGLQLVNEQQAIQIEGVLAKAIEHVRSQGSSQKKPTYANPTPSAATANTPLVQVETTVEKGSSAPASPEKSVTSAKSFKPKTSASSLAANKEHERRLLHLNRTGQHIEAFQLLDTAAVVGADTQAQAVSLMFRVHLPSSVSTMMRVTEGATLEELLFQICEKRNLEPVTHALAKMDGTMYDNTKLKTMKVESIRSKEIMLKDLSAIVSSRSKAEQLQMLASHAPLVGDAIDSTTVAEVYVHVHLLDGGKTVMKVPEDTNMSDLLLLIGQKRSVDVSEVDMATSATGKKLWSARGTVRSNNVKDVFLVAKKAPKPTNLSKARDVLKQVVKGPRGKNSPGALRKIDIGSPSLHIASMPRVKQLTNRSAAEESDRLAALFASGVHPSDPRIPQIWMTLMELAQLRHIVMVTDSALRARVLAAVKAAGGAAELVERGQDAVRHTLAQVIAPTPHIEEATTTEEKPRRPAPPAPARPAPPAPRPTQKDDMDVAGGGVLAAPVPAPRALSPLVARRTKSHPQPARHTDLSDSAPAEHAGVGSQADSAPPVPTTRTASHTTEHKIPASPKPRRPPRPGPTQTHVADTHLDSGGAKGFDPGTMSTDPAVALEGELTTESVVDSDDVAVPTPATRKPSCYKTSYFGPSADGGAMSLEPGELPPSFDETPESEENAGPSDNTDEAVLNAITTEAFTSTTADATAIDITVCRTPPSVRVRQPIALVPAMAELNMQLKQVLGGVPPREDEKEKSSVGVGVGVAGTILSPSRRRSEQVITPTSVPVSPRRHSCGSPLVSPPPVPCVRPLSRSNSDYHDQAASSPLLMQHGGNDDGADVTRAEDDHKGSRFETKLSRVDSDEESADGDSESGSPPPPPPTKTIFNSTKSIGASTANTNTHAPLVTLEAVAQIAASVVPLPRRRSVGASPSPRRLSASKASAISDESDTQQSTPVKDHAVPALPSPQCSPPTGPPPPPLGVASTPSDASEADIVSSLTEIAASLDAVCADKDGTDDIDRLVATSVIPRPPATTHTASPSPELVFDHDNATRAQLTQSGSPLPPTPASSGASPLPPPSGFDLGPVPTSPIHAATPPPPPPPDDMSPLTIATPPPPPPPDTMSPLTIVSPPPPPPPDTMSPLITPVHVLGAAALAHLPAPVVGEDAVALTTTCTACRAVLAGTVKFCGECGAAVGAAADVDFFDLPPPPPDVVEDLTLDPASLLGSDAAATAIIPPAPPMLPQHLLSPDSASPASNAHGHKRASSLTIKRESFLDTIRTGTFVLKRSSHDMESQTRERSASESLNPRVALLASLGRLGKGTQSLRKTPTHDRVQMRRGSSPGNSVQHALSRALDSRRSAVTTHRESVGQDDDNDDWED